jgi:hypothetical protein
MEQSRSWEADSRWSSQEYILRLENPNVHFCDNKSPTLNYVISQINEVYALPCYSFNIVSILAFHLQLGSPSDPFFRGFNQIMNVFSFLKYVRRVDKLYFNIRVNLSHFLEIFQGYDVHIRDSFISLDFVLPWTEVPLFFRAARSTPTSGLSPIYISLSYKALFLQAMWSWKFPSSVGVKNTYS